MYLALLSNLTIFSRTSSVIACFSINQGAISALTSSGIFERRLVFRFIITQVLFHVLHIPISIIKRYKSLIVHEISLKHLVLHTWLHEQKHGLWLHFGLTSLAAYHSSLMLQPKCQFPILPPFILYTYNLSVLVVNLSNNFKVGQLMILKMEKNPMISIFVCLIFGLVSFRN